MNFKKALLMIDLQNDFCTGGSLAVPFGEAVVPLANQLQTQFDIVLATQDWHPIHHTSFAVNHPGHAVGEVVTVNGLPQILWPVHCVQQTKGAELYPALSQTRIQKIFYKGVDPFIDSYSAFFDNAHLRSTGLEEYLRDHQVQEVYILGLATDYCVKYSVLDALCLQFKVFLLKQACRGVDLKVGDSDRAIIDMQSAGVVVVV